MFDPNATEYDGDGAGADRTLCVEGEQLLAFVYLHGGIKRTSGNPPRPYVRLKAEAIGGEQSGATMWTNVFLDPKGYKRLAGLCRAIGYTDAFNPLDGDLLPHILLGRPFVAVLGIETDTYQGRNEEVSFVRFYGGEMTPERAQLADRWIERWERRGGSSGSNGGSNGGGGAHDFDDDAPLPDADVWG